MKFETSIHKIVKNHQQIFCKDPCTHARTRGTNMRARISSRQNARAHVYASCVRVYARIFTKINLIILYYVMNKSVNFHNHTLHQGVLFLQINSTLATISQVNSLVSQFIMIVIKLSRFFNKKLFKT